ncbi:MAG: S-layer homology domain-containing protein, partial [Clostridia bacterium]|nr:S-layer homology domain-containing protein [Clostridia bacterium]
DFLGKAKEFSEKMNPSISDKIEVSLSKNYESLYNTEYSYKLTHKENGIPVYGNTGSLTLSADGETLTNYYLTFSEGFSYKNPENAISREEAEKAYADELGMVLSYKAEYDGRSRKAYLSYIPEKTYGTYIDAFSGKATEPAEELSEMFSDAVTEEAAADKAAGSLNSANRFSEAELNEFSKLENLISKEDAEKIIRDLKILRNDKAKVKNISTSRDYYDENKYYYSMSFEGEDYYYASAKIDAVTGKVLNFYQDSEYKEVPEDDKEKMDKKIKGYLAILCPGETGDDKEYRMTGENDNITSRRFIRHINDIPYDNDTVRIEVSGSDGSLRSYSYSKTEMEFPAPEGIITESEAADKMFDMVDYEMYYYPVRDKDGKSVKTYLFYMMNETAEIDAFTGERKNGYEKLEIPEYTDIEGHFAEDAIKVLKRFGIGFAESEFRPDDIITQKDFISLLTYAVKRYTTIILAKDYDAEGAYNSAFSYDILSKEERNDDAEVKRSDATIYFIKALDLSEIASLPGIYNCPFSDVTEKVGYVSILYGLGVVKGDGTGLYNPERGVSRGEAAVMIYNYLAR